MNGRIALALGLLALAGIAAWYFLFYKGAAAAARIKAMPTGLGAADNACFQRLLDYFKANTADSGAALGWMLGDVEKRMDGTDPVSPDYQIGGKIPKSGAFMAVYAAEYFNAKEVATAFGGALDKDRSKTITTTTMSLKPGKTPQQFNDEIYAIWYAYKDLAVQQQLLAQ